MSSWCMHLFSLQSSLIDSLRIWAFTVCICPNIQWARTTDLAWIRLPVTTKIVKHLLCWPTTRTFISDDHMGQNIWWSTPLDCLGWPWIALDGLGWPWIALDGLRFFWVKWLQLIQWYTASGKLYKITTNISKKNTMLGLIGKNDYE